MRTTSAVLLSLIALLTITSGCAPRAQLMVYRPAELDVGGLERLAIIDFEGEQQSGKIARSALQGQLFDNKYYQLIDQAELARVRPVLRPDGSPDVAAALEAGRVIGVDVLLTGQVVSYNVLDDLQTDTHLELGGSTSKGKGGTSSGLGIGLDSTQTLTREASVSVAVKLIDVRTGELRAARQFAHTFNGKRVNGQGELPNREAILTKLLNQCSHDVVRMIAPHYLQQEVVLAKQYYGAGLNEVRTGNKLATQGNWREAEQRWQAVAKEHPQNHQAHYNLALAAEARQDYPTAKQHLEAALKQYGSTTYQKTKQRMVRSEQQFAAAAQQAESRPSVIAMRNPRPPMQPLGPPPAYVQQPPPMSPAYPQQQAAYPQQPPPFHQPPQPMPPPGPPAPYVPQVLPASHSQLPGQ